MEFVYKPYRPRLSSLKGCYSQVISQAYIGLPAYSNGPDWAAARTFLDPLEALHFCRTDVPVNTNIRNAY